MVVFKEISMNALAVDVQHRLSDSDRFALRGLEGELHRWGKAIYRHYESEGFPSANVLETFIGGSGGNIPGHRILCLNMPTDIYVVHMRVIRLPTDEQDAMLVWYGVPPKEDGSLWTATEKAFRLGIAERTFRLRRQRAKLRILGLPVDL